MSEQSAGLRFNIYERVSLPENKPAIGELEQIELVPHVRGIPEQDQMRLKGHLQLSAIYMSGEDETRSTAFEHRIPVEITLPVRSGGAGGEVEVSIDQFDVELLSARSLNVTGVLSLQGWERAPEGSDARTPGEDQFLAVHYADHADHGDQADESVEAAVGQGAEEVPVSGDLWELDPPAAHVPYPGLAEPAAGETQQKTDEQVSSPAAESGDTADPVFQPAADSADEAKEVWQPGALENDQDADIHLSGPHDRESEPAATDDPSADEKVELKVAFKSQTSFEPAEGAAVGTSGSRPGKSDNSLSWRKLFLAKEAEEQFRKVRLCIVQKEDTIESIAEKYQLNAREIALYNRLGESDVTEGQVLYLPIN